MGAAEVSGRRLLASEEAPSADQRITIGRL